MSTTGRIATKAALAGAVVGGGAIALGATSASAQEAPPEVPPWLQDLGSDLAAKYGPTLAKAGERIDAFVQGLRPEDDPSTAEVVATPEHASGTAWQDDSGDFVVGRSEATPEGARVILLRAFGHDLLTREGDADGGTYGGEAAWLGDGIDWVNERTCPSGVHGGEELCITFLDSSATNRTTEPGQQVTRTTPLKPVVEGIFTEAQIDGIRGLNANQKTALKNARTAYLNDLATADPLQATGTAQGTATNNDASFSLFKASKGADSLTLFPSAANSSSIEFAAGPLTTAATTIPNPLRALVPVVLSQPTAGIVQRLLPETITLPAQTVQYEGSPRECASSASANDVAGTGIFAEAATFLGHPKQAFAQDECELVTATSGNTP